MTAAFTVILPHKRNPGNNAALSICIDCLMQNTVNDFALVIDAAVNEPLQVRINRMVKSAPTEICVYHASDMFFAPKWDQPMLDALNWNTMVTNVVVEPRAIAMHAMNLERNFGMKPETFDRVGFESWCEGAPVPSGEGWFCPFMFHKERFFEFGGLEEDRVGDDGTVFNDADTRLFDRWKAAGNYVVRAPSFVYHLQRWSDEAEQVHEKRGGA